MPGSQSHSEIREGCTVIEKMVEDREPLAGLSDRIDQVDSVYFVGCGSSYWTGVIGQYLLFDVGIDARVEFASEFASAHFPVDDQTLVVGLSQSGETTETVQAIELAATRGAQTAAITNSADSTLDRITDVSYVIPAGTEEAIMATKSVDGAVTAMYLIADRLSSTSHDLSTAAKESRKALDVDISAAVDLLETADRLYTLGSGSYYGLAGEAATKFAESTLQHATPLPTLEIGHGPIANVNGDLALLFAMGDVEPTIHQHMIENLHEAGAETLVIHPAEESYRATASIPLATSSTVLKPLKITQRLAYNGAMSLGYDPDNPPQLSKHVEISAFDSLQ
ncbi:SIS domain-containing protein [Halorhabdus rudnickae]|uniref:SIS domain-containing protein n=1 Tax=Halorhabdus rudnickae TaxID=1775544 RepID=UPI001082B8D9|nr:SIS domain-containing protein [Halorhabdus rudnickae]